MADDVQDIYVSTDAGTEWQSLSALAAEQVDCTLPIESVDATVKVDGNASVFTVSTGGTERVKIDANALVKSETGYVELNSNQNGWNNRFLVSNNAFTYNTGFVNQEVKRYVKESDGATTQVVKEGVYGLTTTVSDWGAKAGHTLFRNLVGPHVIQAEQSIRLITQVVNNDPDVTNPTAGLFFDTISAESPRALFDTSQCGVLCVDTTVQLQTQSTPNSSKRTRLTVADTEVISEVEIQTPSVRGLADNDAEVTLNSNFTVSTGNAGQIRLEPGQSSNNYFRVYDTGSLNGAMLCARDSTTNALTVRPYKTTVTGNVYSAFNMLWDYTDDTVDFTNADKDFILNGYNSPSPTCKGDTYFAFNVGGIGAQTDFTLTAGLHLNVASQLAPDKEAYSILSDGTAPSRFSAEIQTPSVRGLADNDPVFGLNGVFNFQFRNSDGGDGSKINVGYNETSGTGFANVGVGGCYWYLRDSKRFGIGATGINFNANAAAAAGTYDWAMEPDGTFVSNAGRGIEAAFITAGRNNSGGSLATSPKITLTGVSALLAGSDGSAYVPTDSASIATKKIVDDKIWVGTTAQYNQLSKNPTTLYCLTD